MEKENTIESKENNQPENINNEIKNEKDDKEIKKKIIHKMIEGKDNKLNEIFFFLTKLYSGISRASLKFMLTQLYQSKKEDATNESSQVEKIIC